MYRTYKNFLHSFQGDFKILVKRDIFQKNLWHISWNLQDDQGSITCMHRFFHDFIHIYSPGQGQIH